MNCTDYGKNQPCTDVQWVLLALPPENEHLIQQAISELPHVKTIITIAHRLAAIQNAGQILAVDDGRSAECRTHEALIAQDGLYRRFTAIWQQSESWNL